MTEDYRVGWCYIAVNHKQPLDNTMLHGQIAQLVQLAAQRHSIKKGSAVKSVGSEERAMVSILPTGETL